MKILFIASNPKSRSSARSTNSLELEREITEVQRRLLSQDKLGTIDMKVLPSIDALNLVSFIEDYKPDILHVVAHGDREYILFSSDTGRPREITGSKFAALLGAAVHKPKLIFVSACSSGKIAKKLTDVAHFAVGTTGSILSAAARKAAGVFYEWLARGYSLRRAYEAANAIVDIEDAETELIFESDRSKDPEKFPLANPLRLLACFPVVERLRNQTKRRKAFNLKPNSDGEFEIELGICGCPDDTRQVMFFVDDEDFLGSGKIDVDSFAWIDRRGPTKGEIWIEDDGEHLLTPGDCFFYGAVTTRAGIAEITTSLLTTALERYYFVEERHVLRSKDAKDQVEKAIELLRQQDGSRRSTPASPVKTRQPANRRRDGRKRKAPRIRIKIAKKKKPKIAAGK